MPGATVTTPPAIRILNALRIARTAQRRGTLLDPATVIDLLTGKAKA